MKRLWLTPLLALLLAFPAGAVDWNPIGEHHLTLRGGSLHPWPAVLTYGLGGHLGNHFLHGNVTVPMAKAWQWQKETKHGYALANLWSVSVPVAADGSFGASFPMSPAAWAQRIGQTIIGSQRELTHQVTVRWLDVEAPRQVCGGESPVYWTAARMYTDVDGYIQVFYTETAFVREGNAWLVFGLWTNDGQRQAFAGELARAFKNSKNEWRRV